MCRQSEPGTERLVHEQDTVADSEHETSLREIVGYAEYCCLIEVWMHHCGCLVEGENIVLNGIHHVSINVQDVDQAIRFYVGVLGLEEIDRPDLGFPGAWLKNHDQEVHLLGIQSTPPPKEQHFAFAVDDLAEVTRTLESAGYECSQPNLIPGVCVQAFTHDPSGNMVEFNQRLA